MLLCKPCLSGRWTVAARRSAPCASVLLSCSTQKGPAAVASSSSLMMEALQVAAFCRSRGHALVLARAVAASGTDTDGVRLSAQRRRRLHLPALTSRRWGHPRRLRSELRGRRGECAAAEGVRGCRGSARLPRELYASGAFCSAAAAAADLAACSAYDSLWSDRFLPEGRFAFKKEKRPSLGRRMALLVA